MHIYVSKLNNVMAVSCRHQDAERGSRVTAEYRDSAASLLTLAKYPGILAAPKSGAALPLFVDTKGLLRTVSDLSEFWNGEIEQLRAMQ